MPRPNVTRGALPYAQALERITVLEARVRELEQQLELAAGGTMPKPPPAPRKRTAAKK